MHEEIGVPIIDTNLLFPLYLLFTDYKSTNEPTTSQMIVLSQHFVVYRSMSIIHSFRFYDDQDNRNSKIEYLIFWIRMFSNNGRVKREIFRRCQSEKEYDA